MKVKSLEFIENSSNSGNFFEIEPFLSMQLSNKAIIMIAVRILLVFCAFFIMMQKNAQAHALFRYDHDTTGLDEKIHRLRKSADSLCREANKLTDSLSNKRWKNFGGF